MTLRLALPLALTLAAPVAALDLGSMTPEEEAAFGAAVRAYLMENPQVLVEVITVLEQREAESAALMDQQLASIHQAALMQDGFSFVGGNPDGDITIVEFMDYRCGYCRRAFDEVNALLAADGNIRFVIKEYPILGDQSLLAAQFAVAVQQLHGNDVYKDIHDTLMTLDADVTPEILGRLAESFGLEPAPIMAALETEAVMSILTANQDLGRAMQITGTPTFVIGDRMVRGYVPADQMAALVAEVRAAPAP